MERSAVTLDFKNNPFSVEKRKKSLRFPENEITQNNTRRLPQETIQFEANFFKNPYVAWGNSKTVDLPFMELFLDATVC